MVALKTTKVCQRFQGHPGREHEIHPGPCWARATSCGTLYGWLSSWNTFPFFAGVGKVSRVSKIANCDQIPWWPSHWPSSHCTRVSRAWRSTLRMGAAEEIGIGWWCRRFSPPYNVVNPVLGRCSVNCVPPLFFDPHPEPVMELCLSGLCGWFGWDGWAGTGRFVVKKWTREINGHFGYLNCRCPQVLYHIKNIVEHI